MKNILVATDYSEVADFAVEYAAKLAQKLNANLIIFHAYHFPAVTTGVANGLDIWLYSKQNENNIKELENIIHAKYNISVVGIAKQGQVAEQIHAVVAERGVDLVVMGINRNNFVSNILGTTTSVMIEKTCCPILAIPGDTQFKPFSKVVLATDYKDTENSFDFNAFQTILEVYSSQLSVLNVNNFNKLPSLNQAINTLRFGNIIGVIDFDYEFVESDDVVKGLLQHLGEKQPDLLVMLSRKHELIEKILQPSFTKRMIGKTPVPLLILPEIPKPQAEYAQAVNRNVGS